jgi:magnesium transporter
MIANTAVYRNGGRLHMNAQPDDLEGLGATAKAGKPGDFVAVGLQEPDETEMARVAKVFGLHRLAVGDSLHPAQRPKLEEYADMVFLVLKTLSYGEKTDTVSVGQVSMFLGPTYVVTVRQGADFDLASVLDDLEKNADVLEHGPAAVVQAVCDHVVDAYEDVVSDLEDDIDDVEESVFSGEQTDASKRIYGLNRELTTMRRAIDPLEGPMQRLADAKVPGVAEGVAPFFRHVSDHLARVGDALDALDNLLSSAFDANLSRIGVQQNNDMRLMSAWAAIFAVVSVIAGIYGMNFTNMYELEWSFGYPAALALMLGLGIWLHHRFKQSGWM